MLIYCVKKKDIKFDVLYSDFQSGYQDSNLGPPAPKAGALTGLRYTPLFKSVAKVMSFLLHANF